MTKIDELVSALQAQRAAVANAETEIQNAAHADELACLQALRELHQAGRISTHFVNKTFDARYSRFILEADMQDLSLGSSMKAWAREDEQRKQNVA